MCNIIRAVVTATAMFVVLVVIEKLRSTGPRVTGVTSLQACPMQNSPVCCPCPPYKPLSSVKCYEEVSLVCHWHCMKISHLLAYFG